MDEYIKRLLAAMNGQQRPRYVDFPQFFTPTIISGPSPSQAGVGDMEIGVRCGNCNREFGVAGSPISMRILPCVFCGERQVLPVGWN